MTIHWEARALSPEAIQNGQRVSALKDAGFQDVEAVSGRTFAVVLTRTTAGKVVDEIVKPGRSRLAIARAIVDERLGAAHREDEVLGSRSGKVLHITTPKPERAVAILSATAGVRSIQPVGVS